MTALQWGAISFLSDENSGFWDMLHGNTKVGGILIIKWSPLGGLAWRRADEQTDKILLVFTPGPQSCFLPSTLVNTEMTCMYLK